MLSGVDLFVVNVGLPAIAAAVDDASLAELSWILNVYAIVFAALLVPAGRLADRYGEKGALLAGLAIFGLASLGGGFADQLWQIVAMRGLQAVGAAILVPASLGLVLVAFPPERRTGAVRVWAVAGSVGAAAGPALGGLMVELSWRWVFLFSAPICLAAMLGTALLAPRVRPDRDAAVPDLLGGALLALSVGALTLALVQGEAWAWGSAATLGSLLFSALAGAAFLHRSARHRAPIVDLRLFANRSFSWANAAYVLFAASFGAQLLALTLCLQHGWGWTPLATGLGLAPGPAVVSVVGLGLAGYTNRLPSGVVAAAGSLFLAAGALLIAQSLGGDPNYMAQILPGWLLAGAGVGLAIPTFVAVATQSLPAASASTGSAVVQMSRQIGSVLGVALLVLLLGANGTGSDAIAGAWRWAALLALFAGAAAWRISRAPTGAAGPRA